MRNPAFHIFEQTPDSLGEWCDRHLMPRFRAKQILEWVYNKNVIDPGKMTNLSQRDREALARGITFLSGDVLAEMAASDGVRKLLVQWGEDGESDKAIERCSDAGGDPDRKGARQREGETGEETEAGEELTSSISLRQLGVNHDITPDPSRQTECVMIPSDGGELGRPRRTACISSQVGCPVGCKFCASGLGGLEGNLSAGRIVEQVWRLDHMLQPQPGETPEGPTRITNVVFMGMGEPLSNIGNVIQAIRTLAAPWGLNISARKITISTVGLPKAIDRLANELELPVTLALSLHAPTDEIRRKLIPWAEYTTIADLLAACQKWFTKTGREITLEYTLLRGVNDQGEHALELSRLAKTLRANVNLIRYNEVAGLEFKRPRTEDVRRFQAILRERNINVHIRASRGRDIAAACGQLRHEKAGV